MKELINKYEAGLCTPAEATLVENFLAQELAQGMPEAYVSYQAALKNVQWDKTSEQVLQDQTHDMDMILAKVENGTANEEELAIFEQELNSLEAVQGAYGTYIDQFKTEHYSAKWEENLQVDPNIALFEKCIAGQATTSELEEVRQLLIAQKENMPAAYQSYIDQIKSMGITKSAQEIVGQELWDKATLLEKYELGTCSASEVIQVEQLLASQDIMPDAYQSFVLQEKAKTSSIQAEKVLEKHQNKQEAKVIPLMSRFIRTASVVAAVVILGFTAFYMVEQSNTPQLAENGEITDPDVALEVTLAALGLAGKNLQIGTDEVLKITAIEKTNLFK